VAWFAGIISVLLPLSVAMTKHHFVTALNEFRQSQLETEGRAARIETILAEIDGQQFVHALKVVDSMLSELEKIKRGVIPLDAAQYFHEIIEAMNRAPPGTRVHAVNTIDELRWKNDPREVKYFQANLAALSREVTIDRIFVLSREKFFTGDPRERIEILKEQARHLGPNIGIVWKKILLGNEIKVRDWVAFDKPSLVLYTDYADPIDHTRVSHGEMVVQQGKITTFLSDFLILSEAAMSVDDFIKEVQPPLLTVAPSDTDTADHD
jgi:hypothetical protein